jgi:hypothetical protein
MRVKTVVQERIPHRKITERSIFIAVMIHIINIIFSVILPFVMGFYFARTENMLFFLFFIIAVFIEVRMEYKGDTVKLKILRLL